MVFAARPQSSKREAASTSEVEDETDERLVPLLADFPLNEIRTDITSVESRPTPQTSTSAADGGQPLANNETMHSPSANRAAVQSGRQSRAREKQRANRQQKRANKRDEKKISPGSDGGMMTKPEKVNHRTERKRHRPNQVERSIVFFMKIYDWSQIFLKNESWLSYTKSGGKLDLDTVEAMSRTVKQCWLGKGGGRRFDSIADLERFIDLKGKEADYIEKQLGTMPALQDPAWNAYCRELQGDLDGAQSTSPTLAEEALSGPAEFLRDTILPCLRAQLEFLGAMRSTAAKLYQKYDGLRERCEHQDEMRKLVETLRQDQATLSPICPAWTIVEVEIKRTKGKMLDPVAMLSLRKEKDEAFQAYQDGLRQL
ncbi:hypothetical protein B0T19DRAFT_432551 [Cercophora scortea]|uniref:Uncharacterized protein n=1 Tax=Cercophora scortea TaxID=314031 RepID=A0AAE0I6X9_9PEZI|nr:hypothetical protein B0T19DRAFT_432551 [Cercophora scortea]